VRLKFGLDPKVEAYGNPRRQMKKSAKKEPLLNRLARGVGQAAGKVVMATQGLGMRDTPTIQSGNAGEKSKKKSKPRSMPKKKSAKKSAKRKARKAK
jgi:hypothetical protein